MTRLDLEATKNDFKKWLGALHCASHEAQRHVQAYDERVTWRTELIDLMSNYESKGFHVYTDISCASDPGDFEKIATDLTTGDLKDCRGKVLFGTDYDVISSGSLGEDGRPVGEPLHFYLGKYIKAFRGYDANDGLRLQLEYYNPEKFFRFDDP
jgi:hypothetical protein